LPKELGLETVNVEDPDDPDERVTLDGLSDAGGQELGGSMSNMWDPPPTPLGGVWEDDEQLTDNETVAAKWFRLVSWIVDVPAPPALKEMLEGLAVWLKSLIANARLTGPSRVSVCPAKFGSVNKYSPRAVME
jgi:hypothetical protein